LGAGDVARGGAVLLLLSIVLTVVHHARMLVRGTGRRSEE
jgi:hypothetical protein